MYMQVEKINFSTAKQKLRIDKIKKKHRQHYSHLFIQQEVPMST